MMRAALIAGLVLVTPALAGAADHAVAVLHAPDGRSMGAVHFMADGAAVRVVGKVTGAGAGRHGFHVHEFGDCSSPDFTSAGGHFNPTGDPHAAPGDAKRHAGDLGNIEANADGSAAVEVSDSKLSFSGPANIVGRAVIVHAKADDMKTQPTGDAGGRIACGVIGIAKPEADAKH